MFTSGKNQLSGAPTMVLQVTELGTQETCLLSKLDGMHWGIASSRPTGGWTAAFRDREFMFML